MEPSGPPPQFCTILKVLTIGNSGVGKTCLIVRFTDNTFKSQFISTIGVECKSIKVQVKRKTIRLQLWDTAGQERFRTITSSYYRGAHGVAVVYDVTDRSSFDRVLSWLEEIEQNSTEKLLRVLLANKIDKEARGVTEAEGRVLAQRYNLSYFEVSAKTGQGVTEAFTFMAEQLVERMEKSPSLLPRQSFTLNEDETVQVESSCCR